MAPSGDSFSGKKKIRTVENEDQGREDEDRKFGLFLWREAGEQTSGGIDDQMRRLFPISADIYTSGSRLIGGKTLDWITWFNVVTKTRRSHSESLDSQYTQKKVMSTTLMH